MRRALAARRVQKQMSLAAELGVDESAISRWQRGAGLSITHAARLCEALDISLDWLILGRGDMDLHHRSAAPAGAAATPVDPIAALPAPVAEAVGRLISVIDAELNAKPQR